MKVKIDEEIMHKQHLKDEGGFFRPPPHFQTQLDNEKQIQRWGQNNNQKITRN